MEKFTVYVLFSKNANRHYTGFTSNLKQRLLSHHELGKGWTSKFRHWTLIFAREFPTKAQAMKFEKWLKTGAGRDFIRTLHSSKGFISAAADGSSSLLSGTKLNLKKVGLFYYGTLYCICIVLKNGKHTLYRFYFKPDSEAIVSPATCQSLDSQVQTLDLNIYQRISHKSPGNGI